MSGIRIIPVVPQLEREDPNHWRKNSNDDGYGCLLVLACILIVLLILIIILQAYYISRCDEWLFNCHELNDILFKELSNRELTTK
jgi:hypothetical protein